MAHYLWDLTGSRWEITFREHIQLWELEDPDECPFVLTYARMAAARPAHCEICHREAEPAVFLRTEDGVKNREVGPFCVDCVSSGPAWHLQIEVPSRGRPTQES